MSCFYLYAMGTGTLLWKAAKIDHTCVGGKDTPETAFFPPGKRQTSQLLQESSHIRLDSILKGESLPGATRCRLCSRTIVQALLCSWKGHKNLDLSLSENTKMPPLPR